MGVLGGFKNMLKTWRNNLRRKKKEKKNKQKKNSLFYSLLAIIIYPFTIIFEKSNKITIKTIEKKIETSKEIKQLEEVKIEFNQIKNQVNVIKQKEIEEKINIKEQKIKTEEKIFAKKIKATNLIKKINRSNNNEKQKNNVTNNEIKNDVKPEFKTTEKEISKNKKLEISNQEPSIIITNNILSNFKKTDETNENKEPVLFNYEIKNEIEDELKKISDESITFKKYNESYQISYKIKELKEKIEFLKEEYENNNLIFEDNLSFEDIENLELQINNLEKQLEIKKKTLLNPKEEKNIDKESNTEEKETKKEEKIDEKKEDKNEEFELCSKAVIENIEKCNRQYNSYLKEIKRYNKKSTLFRHINVLSSSILSFMVGIIPFKFIRNRILRNYVTAINTNNIIRTMNRMINPLNTNNYYLLLNEYRTLDEVIQNTYTVMNDSLERIIKIKEDLINLGVQTLDKELYNKLLNMESLITENIKQMAEKHKDLSKIYVKIKKD